MLMGWDCCCRPVASPKVGLEEVSVVVVAATFPNRLGIVEEVLGFAGVILPKRLGVVVVIVVVVVAFVIEVADVEAAIPDAPKVGILDWAPKMVEVEEAGVAVAVWDLNIVVEVDAVLGELLKRLGELVAPKIEGTELPNVGAMDTAGCWAAGERKRHLM
jgi:hypothetical protein